MAKTMFTTRWLIIFSILSFFTFQALFWKVPTNYHAVAQQVSVNPVLKNDKYLGTYSDGDSIKVCPINSDSLDSLSGSAQVPSQETVGATTYKFLNVDKDSDTYDKQSCQSFDQKQPLYLLLIPGIS